MKRMFRPWLEAHAPTLSALTNNSEDQIRKFAPATRKQDTTAVENLLVDECSTNGLRPSADLRSL